MKIFRSIKLVSEIAFSFVGLLLGIVWRSGKQTLIFGLPLGVLYGLYEFVIRRDQVSSLGIYVLTPLALLIAFTSLLFARARVIEEDQELNISSADQAFRACIFYSEAIVWGFVIATINWLLQDVNIYLPKEILTIFYAPSFFCIGFAYMEIFKALSKVWPSLNK